MSQIAETAARSSEDFQVSGGRVVPRRNEFRAGGTRQSHQQTMLRMQTSYHPSAMELFSGATDDCILLGIDTLNLGVDVWREYVIDDIVDLLATPLADDAAPDRAPEPSK